MSQAAASALARGVVDALASVWFGRTEVLEHLVVAALARGHVLLEDVPGVGKTTLVHALAQALGATASRVQFTADLLPGDITGVPVLVPGQAEPVFRPGPIFAQVVLADEINRGTPRVQSALLEAMGEGGVTVDGTTHPLPTPFLVAATQNPFEAHGTWPLPESQLDRFLMRLSLGYPDRAAARAILRQDASPGALPPVTDSAGWSAAAAAVGHVRVDAVVEDHLLDLVDATRRHPALWRGVSPRGAQAMHRAARARAIVHSRDYVVPEDVQALAVPVWAHRVVSRSHPEEAQAAIEAIVRGHVPPG